MTISRAVVCFCLSILGSIASYWVQRMTKSDSPLNQIWKLSSIQIKFDFFRSKGPLSQIFLSYTTAFGCHSSSMLGNARILFSKLSLNHCHVSCVDWHQSNFHLVSLTANTNQGYPELLISPVDTGYLLIISSMILIYRLIYWYLELQTIPDANLLDCNQKRFFYSIVVTEIRRWYSWVTIQMTTHDLGSTIPSVLLAKQRSGLLNWRRKSQGFGEKTFESWIPKVWHQRPLHEQTPRDNNSRWVSISTKCSKTSEQLEKLLVSETVHEEAVDCTHMQKKLTHPKRHFLSLWRGLVNFSWSWWS